MTRFTGRGASLALDRGLAGGLPELAHARVAWRQGVRGGRLPGETHLLVALPRLLALFAALQEVALLARVRRLRLGLHRVPGRVRLRLLADRLC